MGRRPWQLPHPRDDNDDLPEDERAMAAEERPCPTCNAKGHCPTCGGRGKVLPREAQGALLRARRLEANVTLKQMAEAMEISANHIGDIELGQRRITADLRRRYLDALEECS